MAAMITFTCLAQSSSLSTLSVTPKLYSSKTLLLPHRAHGCFSPCQSTRDLKFKTADTVPAEKRGLSLICSYNAGDESDTKYYNSSCTCNWREPFNLQKGWLLWAGIGLLGALASIALTGAVVSLFRGENPQRETDALVLLLPLIGSSSTSTACLVGITGVLAPLLEETVFRGFFMVSLTKWLPTPLSVLVSAAVFAVAHLTPG